MTEILRPKRHDDVNTFQFASALFFLGETQKGALDGAATLPSSSLNMTKTIGSSLAALRFLELLARRHRAAGSPGKHHDRHADYLHSLRSGVKQQAKLLNAFAESASERRAKEAFVEAQVALEAGMDGDAGMQTQEAFSKRFALRNSPLVREALQTFWEAALRSMQSGGDAEISYVDETGYALLFFRVYRTLMEEVRSQDMCHRASC